MPFIVEYIKFLIIALLCILVGVPIWIAIIAPDMFSLTMVFELRFWIPVIIGLILMSIGVFVGKMLGVDKYDI